MAESARDLRENNERYKNGCFGNMSKLKIKVSRFKRIDFQL